MKKSYKQLQLPWWNEIKIKQIEHDLNKIKTLQNENSKTSNQSSMANNL